jgi:hypothetical protein
MEEKRPQGPLGEIMALREPDIEGSPGPTYHFAGVSGFGNGVFAAVLPPVQRRLTIHD